MKIIQTNRFLKKQAQFADANLPPGVTDQMIDEQGRGEEAQTLQNQSGEYEAKIDWGKETNDLINAGYDVQGLPQNGLGDIKVYYTYNAEVYGGDVQINNLTLSDIMTFMGQKYQPLTVSEPSTKNGLFEGLQDEIAEQEKRIIREQSQSGVNYGPDRTEELY